MLGERATMPRPTLVSPTHPRPNYSSDNKIVSAKLHTIPRFPPRNSERAFADVAVVKGDDVSMAVANIPEAPPLCMSRTSNVIVLVCLCRFCALVNLWRVDVGLGRRWGCGFSVLGE